MGEDYLRHKDIIYRVRSERCCEFESRQLRLGQAVPSLQREEVMGELCEPVDAGELVILAFAEPGSATLFQGRRVVGHLPEQAAAAALQFADGAAVLAAALEPSNTPLGGCRVILYKQRAS